MYRTLLRWENQLRSLYNSSWRRWWGPKLKHTAVEKKRVWSYTGRIKRNGKGEFHLKKKGDCRVMSSRLNTELEVFWFVYLFNKDLTTSFVPHIITEIQLCIPKFLCIPIIPKTNPYPHGSREDRQTYNLTLGSAISKSGEERERSVTATSETWRNEGVSHQNTWVNNTPKVRKQEKQRLWAGPCLAYMRKSKNGTWCAGNKGQRGCQHIKSRGRRGHRKDFVFYSRCKRKPL